MPSFTDLALVIANEPSAAPSTIRRAWQHDPAATHVGHPAAPADVLAEARTGYSNFLARRPGMPELLDITTDEIIRQLKAKTQEPSLIHTAVHRFQTAPTTPLAGALVRLTVAVLGSRLFMDAVLKADTVGQTRARVTIEYASDLTRAHIDELLSKVSRVDIVTGLLRLEHDDEIGLDAIRRTLHRHGEAIKDDDFRKLVKAAVLSNAKRDWPYVTRAVEALTVLDRTRHRLICNQERHRGGYRRGEVASSAPELPNLPGASKADVFFNSKSSDPATLAVAVDRTILVASHEGHSEQLIRNLLTNEHLRTQDLHRLLTGLADNGWQPKQMLDLRVLHPGDVVVENAWRTIWAPLRMAEYGWDDFGGYTQVSQLLTQWTASESARDQATAFAGLRRTMPEHVVLTLPVETLTHAAQHNGTTRAVISRLLGQRVMNDPAKVSILETLYDDFTGTLHELLDTIDALAA